MRIIFYTVYSNKKGIELIMIWFIDCLTISFDVMNITVSCCTLHIDAELAYYYKVTTMKWTFLEKK